MGHMKNLLITIYGGGDEAVEAACELAAFPMERLRLLSQYGDFPTPDNAANRDNTPATRATPSKGIEQSECTLTDEEREAIESAIWDYSQNDDDEDCARMVATLERLLERMA